MSHRNITQPGSYKLKKRLIEKRIPRNVQSLHSMMTKSLKSLNQRVLILWSQRLSQYSTTRHGDDDMRALRHRMTLVSLRKKRLGIKTTGKQHCPLARFNRVWGKIANAILYPRTTLRKTLNLGMFCIPMFSRKYFIVPTIIVEPRNACWETLQPSQRMNTWKDIKNTPVITNIFTSICS